MYDWIFSISSKSHESQNILNRKERCLGMVCNVYKTKFPRVVCNVYKTRFPGVVCNLYKTRFSGVVCNLYKTRFPGGGL